MASARPSLHVELREERGSRAARRMRRAGQVPGVLYGGSHPEGVSFKVDVLDLRRVLAEGSALVDVELGGERSVPAILKDRQLHPVRDDYVHVDLLEVDLQEKIRATVTIELQGVEEAPGVSEGGVLDHATWEVEIEALPTDIPEQVHADVSELEMGGTLTLADVAMPDGVEIVAEAPEEVTIASVVVPTKVEEPEIEEETELVGEEGEELAEGEEAPEGEGEGGESESGDSGGDE